MEKQIDEEALKQKVQKYIDNTFQGIRQDSYRLCDVIGYKFTYQNQTRDGYNVFLYLLF